MGSVEGLGGERRVDVVDAGGGVELDSRTAYLFIHIQGDSGAPSARLLVRAIRKHTFS